MLLFIKAIEWWDKKKAREPGSISAELRLTGLLFIPPLNRLNE